MAIVNRDKDVSEQKVSACSVFAASVGASAGANFHLWMAPFPCEVKAVAVSASGISGAPTASINNLRFVVGAGATQILGIGATLTVLANGTSGPQTFTMGTAGSTIMQMQAGDILVYNQLFSGGNVASANTTVSVVVKKLQDIVSHWGSAV